MHQDQGRYASIGDIITCSVKKATKGKVSQVRVVAAWSWPREQQQRLAGCQFQEALEYTEIAPDACIKDPARGRAHVLPLLPPPRRCLLPARLRSCLPTRC